MLSVRAYFKFNPPIWSKDSKVRCQTRMLWTRQHFNEKFLHRIAKATLDDTRLLDRFLNRPWLFSWNQNTYVRLDKIWIMIDMKIAVSLQDMNCSNMVRLWPSSVLQLTSVLLKLLWDVFIQIKGEQLPINRIILRQDYICPSSCFHRTWQIEILIFERSRTPSETAHRHHIPQHALSILLYAHQILEMILGVWWSIFDAWTAEYSRYYENPITEYKAPIEGDISARKSSCKFDYCCPISATRDIFCRGIPSCRRYKLPASSSS